jgi:hypothetical protein
MWGGNWSGFRWGGGVAVPALGFWGAIVLGCLIGVCGVLVLRSSRKTAGAMVILSLLIPLTAVASVPFTFTNGQIADANQVNADLVALTPIQGTQTFQTRPGPGSQVDLPSSPAFTAPRNLTCLVTVEAIGQAGGTGEQVLFNPVVQVGSTLTGGSANNLYFAFTAQFFMDFNYFATYTQSFSVSAGSPVSFGMAINVVSPGGFEATGTAVYSCI